MGKIGHRSEKVSPDHMQGVPSSQCPLKTGFTVLGTADIG